jgi:hypothetical protein
LILENNRKMFPIPAMKGISTTWKKYRIRTLVVIPQVWKQRIQTTISTVVLVENSPGEISHPLQKLICPHSRDRRILFLPTEQLFPDQTILKQEALETMPDRLPEQQ